VFLVRHYFIVIVKFIEREGILICYIFWFLAFKKAFQKFFFFSEDCNVLKDFSTAFDQIN